VGAAAALSLTSAPPAHAAARQVPRGLSAGSTLAPGQVLTSRSGGFTVTMQHNGALVERAQNGQQEWSSGTSRPGSDARLLAGGALRVRSPAGTPLWSSHSGGHPARHYRLVTRSNGALVLLNPGHRPIWTNGLASRCGRNLPAQAIIMDITLQHLWACHHATLVLSTPVTTGAYQRGWITPTGTGHIYAKERNVNLVGPSWDDHVKYWMPYRGPFGLHDAAWQKFPEGSPKYKTKGSHGCVHLPAIEMKALFHWAKIGARVTVRQ
jgi:lipoprotein-anchoring transpeptidase ErfK/SrfK